MFIRLATDCSKIVQKGASEGRGQVEEEDQDDRGEAGRKLFRRGQTDVQRVDEPA